jgi:hypothetical protein
MTTFTNPVISRLLSYMLATEKVQNLPKGTPVVYDSPLCGPQKDCPYYVHNICMNSKFTLREGDRVRVNEMGSRMSTVMPGSIGTVIEANYSISRALVEFTSEDFPSGSVNVERILQVIELDRITRVIAHAPSARERAVKLEPKVPTKPMTKAVLEVLKSKGSLTGLEAGGVLKCRDLPKRISELRAMGWNIRVEYKRDPRDGQRYARYHMEDGVQS